MVVCNIFASDFMDDEDSLPSFDSDDDKMFFDDDEDLPFEDVFENFEPCGKLAIHFFNFDADFYDR